MLVNDSVSESRIANRQKRLSTVDTELADALKEVSDITDEVQVAAAISVLKEIGHTKQAIGTAAEWLLYDSPDNADRAIAIANAVKLKTVQNRIKALLAEHGNRFDDVLRDLPWDRK